MELQLLSNGQYWESKWGEEFAAELTAKFIKVGNQNLALISTITTALLWL